ncbi:hypothetical protein [Streptomyces sp. NPDC008139]|uniref:hypothetical protein n=1 Tax=Streptomyces sp. NPDC008139 TaxID=3364814 RepID=UPI0036E85961
MALEHPRGSGDGCLTVAIRMPVRLVAFAVVLPLRLLWDALATAGRATSAGLRWTWRRLLLPPLRVLGAALARAVRTLVVIPAVFLTRYLVVVPVVALWRYVLVPLGHAAAWTLRMLGTGTGLLAHWLLVVPLTALYTYVLAPVGRAVRWTLLTLGAGLGAGASWLGHYLLAVPARWLWHSLLVPLALALAAAVVFFVRYALVWPLAALWRYVLTPVGRGLAWTLRMTWLGLLWLVRTLVVLPVGFVWRRVVVPVAREVGAALGHAWRVTGYVSRAVGRGIAWLARVLIAVPAAWVWSRTGAPVLRAVRAAGRWYRRAVWQPVKEAVADARRSLRELRAETRRALFGDPVGAAERRLPPRRAGYEPGAFGPAPATDAAEASEAPDPADALVASALAAQALPRPAARHRKRPGPDLDKLRPPTHR